MFLSEWKKLRDRVDGRVHIDCCQAGVPSLFSQEEESFLVEHVKTMAEIGYGVFNILK
jgi:hypothetical protein